MWVLLIIVLLAFLCGVLLVLGLAAPSRGRSLIDERIAAITRPASAPARLPTAEAQLEMPFAERILWPFLRRLSGFAARLTPGGTAASVRSSLDKAGRPIGLGVNEFLGLRVLSAVLSLTFALLAMRYLGNTLPLKTAAFGFSLLAGLAAPDALLQQKIAARQALILKALPDTLDLLVVSVEAGLGFDGAVARVTEKTHGPLADELQRAQQEIQLGKTRGQALKDMAARADVPEIRALVAAVFQADQLGVSFARMFRVQSETIRAQRIQRVRETAARLPIKMLFPLVLFLFPALFVILLGPPLLNLLKVFSGK